MSEKIWTAKEILAVPMGPNDASAGTVRQYLVELLSLVWKDRDIFNGKRPFGNSGWEYEIYTALAEAGAIEGTPDEGLSRDQEWKADEMIDRAITYMRTH